MYNITALILLWLILFVNVRSGPQNYIFGYIGIGMWFFTNNKNSVLNYILIILVFVLCLLCDTRLGTYFSLRYYVYDIYKMPVIPSFLIWLKISFDILKDTHKHKLTKNKISA